MMQSNVDDETSEQDQVVSNDRIIEARKQTVRVRNKTNLFLLMIV